MSEIDRKSIDVMLPRREASRWLREALNLSEGETPFPWQQELLVRFLNGRVDRALDIPTGLGKTAVMAIWLVARAMGALVPRRLVYIVDRRAVVDQATNVAEGLRTLVDKHADFKQALGLGKRSLPISTLRGQYVDNKEWLEDAASPAIIVGTVDMIGSRLLFEGYGVSRKMRPYQAGFLGADSLVVLDEAHLVPSFEKLLESIADGSATFGPRHEELQKIVPRLRFLSLSATGRSGGDRVFGLQQKDLEHPVVRRRLEAPKRLTIVPPIEESTKLPNVLAMHAWQLAGEGALPVRIIVFCDKRKDAVAALEAIKDFGKLPTQLFVGGRRARERESVADWLRQYGFIAGSDVQLKQPAFVFATSAGEVGVDLDADHMVSDLVAWERMIQRLGRVNRRGDGDARIVVVTESPSKELQKATAKAIGDRSAHESRLISDDRRKVAVKQLVDQLPEKELARDASPGAIRELKASAAADLGTQRLIEAAITPAPLRPALSRALIDAWSMTSLEEHTGRPEIDPWLRGWIEDDPPQTAVIWRKFLPVRADRTESPKEIEAFFEAAPAHATEQLEMESYAVAEWLIARARALRASDEIIAIALSPAGDFRDKWSRSNLAVYDDVEDKKKKQAIEKQLRGAMLIVHAQIGGLTAEGLLDEKVVATPQTIDDDSSWNLSHPEPADSGANRSSRIPGFRVDLIAPAERPADDGEWYERFRFRLTQEDDSERWLVVKWRDDASTEDDRSEGRLQHLDVHQRRVEELVRIAARQLRLPQEYEAMLAAVAAVHDEGKRASHWQRAFNAPRDGQVYAKTPGPIKVALLDGYRHEFGSLLSTAVGARLADLTDDLREMGLHLIAAHHGFGRPLIRVSGCPNAPPTVLAERAREVAVRFAHLHKRWGPWGLAWFESLLRAADQRASRENAKSDSSATRREAS